MSGLVSLPGPAQTGVSGRDLSGRPVRLLGRSGSRAVVLFFVATDCPISNRYLPEMKRLKQEFAGSGVGFWFVYPNVTESGAAIRAHQAAYAAGDQMLTDPKQELARLTGAKITPEAAVLVPDGTGGELRPVYVGRVDDRYVSIGNERPQATRHDLERAIAAMLAGQPVAGPGGPAVGCGIVSVK